MGFWIGIDQDFVFGQVWYVFIVVWYVLVDYVEVGFWGVEEVYVLCVYCFDGFVDVFGEVGDVLDVFVFVCVQVFVDLVFWVG